MPNRILRDWTDSEPVNSLSDAAEKFFTRLIMKADDFGRYYGDAQMLRPMLYPRQLDAMREANLERLISECEKARLVRLYESDGKKVIEILKFRQQKRAEKSKFPDQCIADAKQPHSKGEATAHLGGGGGGGGGGAPGGRILPTPEMASKWLADWKKNGANYTQSEVNSAFLALSANGWMWGKNPIVDFRAALERQIQTDRERNGGKSSKPKPNQPDF